MKDAIHRALAAVNTAWRSGRPEEMTAHLHSDIVMRMPGFSGETAGRDAFIEGFRQFIANARVLEYSESEEQIDVVGVCGVITYRYEMLYETAEYRARSTGRDFWIFEKQGDKWLAVWRTMMDVRDKRLGEK